MGLLVTAMNLGECLVKRPAPLREWPMMRMSVNPASFSRDRISPPLYTRMDRSRRSESLPRDMVQTSLMRLVRPCHFG
jgi:hypothetical protein